MEITRSVATRRAIRNTAVVAGLEVLAEHRGQQLAGLRDRLASALARPAPPGTRTRPGPAQSISASRAAGSSQSITGLPRRRSHRRGQHRPQLGLAARRRPAASSPRIAERINVTVSIVATASYSGVESSTRFAADQPRRRRRLQRHLEDPVGPLRAASRARMSTSTVCTNPG